MSELRRAYAAWWRSWQGLPGTSRVTNFQITCSTIGRIPHYRNNSECPDARPLDPPRRHVSTDLVHPVRMCPSPTSVSPSASARLSAVRLRLAAIAAHARSVTSHRSRLSFCSERHADSSCSIPADMKMISYKCRHVVRFTATDGCGTRDDIVRVH